MFGDCTKSLLQGTPIAAHLVSPHWGSVLHYLHAPGHMIVNSDRSRSVQGVGGLFHRYIKGLDALRGLTFFEKEMKSCMHNLLVGG